MTTPMILAIDQGGQSSRVAVYSVNGEQLHCVSSPCATQHRRTVEGEYIEQDPLDILNGIRLCLEQVADTLGDNLKAVTAAGFAGQGSSLVCWDKGTGEALSPVLSWQDIRGQRYLNNIPLTHAQAQRITGLRVSPHYGASKMRWCLDNNARAKAALHQNRLSIGPIFSFICWHLCHENVVDPGHAQRTLLWNLTTNSWDQTLLKLFAIPPHVLPACKYHDGYFGAFTLKGHKIPLTVSARDQGASLFARGLPDRKSCYINIGTGAFVQKISDSLTAPEGILVSPLWLPQQKVDEQATEVSSPVCYAAELMFDAIKSSLSEPLYALEATINGAASALGFMEEETGLAITPDQMNRALELSPDYPCYFLNAVGSLGAPYWRTDVKSRFSENLSSQAKLLAWLESIIFQVTINVHLMDTTGALQTVRVSGGISKADGVCQRLADLLKIPVYRNDNTDATLQGIAYMAGSFPTGWNPSLHDDIFMPRHNPLLLTRFQQWQRAVEMWLIHNDNHN